MSGGAYDYLCFQVTEFAMRMDLNDDPRRIAFKKHLLKVGDACHAIEWEDSGDTSKENTDRAIDEVFEVLKS